MSVFKHPVAGWLIATAAFWTIMVVVPSFPAFRNLFAAPLILNDVQATGDGAYVLSAGNAFRERLSAAADLYQMGRIPQILLLQDDTRGSYSFTARANWTPTEWALDFLKWRGIPKDKVLIIRAEGKGYFGTLSEARTIAGVLPSSVKRLVLITSAAHTRRSMLAFRRTLPSKIEITPFAATPFRESTEMYDPLWLEYLKLLVYWFIA
jgi:uncharacterized SAM-binding protein YcdF (DUF218 family)